MNKTKNNPDQDEQIKIKTPTRKPSNDPYEVLLNLKWEHVNLFQKRRYKVRLTVGNGPKVVNLVKGFL